MSVVAETWPLFQTILAKSIHQTQQQCTPTSVGSLVNWLKRWTDPVKSWTNRI